jgi:hypothetical protein
MSKSAELLTMIDEGVPLAVALSAIGVSEESLSDRIKAALKERQAAVRARIMSKLYQATQKSSASPNAVATAAKTWLELSKDDSSDSSVSINIETSV